MHTTMKVADINGSYYYRSAYYHSARIIILITCNCRHTKIMHTTITKGERD